MILIRMRNKKSQRKKKRQVKVYIILKPRLKQIVKLYNHMNHRIFSFLFPPLIVAIMEYHTTI